MIKFHCGYCNEELAQPGGLFFSPPMKGGSCLKVHLCVGCSEMIYSMIECTSSILLASNKKDSSESMSAKGGKVRAAKLTPDRRREIASKAAKTRWKK